jgi:hypothetical protein
MPVIKKRKHAAESRTASGRATKRTRITPGIYKAAQAAAKNVFMKNVESKRAVHTSTDGLEVAHNNYITMDGNMLETTQGVKDPMANALESRIGDQINLKGVSIKFMVELNERYADVTFRMFVVKCAKGDAPTDGTLFTGLSGNKMIDTINSERFTVIKSKTFKIVANNFGVDASTSTGGLVVADTNLRLSRATKIVKVWIPGSKIGRNGKVVYENGSSQPKFFDYKVLLFAYSNYSTQAAGGWYVGRLNDYVRVLHYKDA